jgi:hypothetical protein
MRASVLRNPSPIWLGAVGCLVGVVYVLRIMIPNDMDPTIMLAFGADSPVQSTYARGLVGDVTVRDSFGHDGQVFFIQANDPWFLDPESHAVYMDRPVYRGQRMGYPTIASGLGLFPPGWVIWTLPFVNILSLGVGTLAAGRLAQLLGGSTWLGLAFCLNPGVLSEVDISGGGAVALAAGAWGVMALEQGSVWRGAVALSGAALSRETMLAAAVVLAWILWRRRAKDWWVLLALPMAAVALWGAYVRLRLAGLPSSGPALFGPYPLAGPIEAFEFWRNEPLSLVTIFVFLAVCVAFGVRVIHSHQLLAWAAAPTLLIATVVSVSVWRFPYDIGRVLAPIFLAYPFLVVESERAGGFRPGLHANRRANVAQVRADE